MEPENIRNQELTGEQEILVVSFGTSYRETRDKTIGAIEASVEEMFPGWEVRRAFTSRMILKRLRERDGLLIDDPQTALKRALQSGIRRLVVLPTHLMNGREYRMLEEAVGCCADRFAYCKIAAPLLTGTEDFKALAQAVEDELLPRMDDTCAAVLMGHGTDVAANAVYAKLQGFFRESGGSGPVSGPDKPKTGSRFLVATVEGTPTLEQILPEIKSSGCRRVLLAPLMIVAGDHAVNDLAGDDEDSWKNVLKREGYEVSVLLKGLGEYPQIRNLFAVHAREVMMPSGQ